MKRTIASVKIVLLLAALSVVAWSSGASTARAVICRGAGETCHVDFGGTVKHYEEQPSY